MSESAFPPASSAIEQASHWLMLRWGGDLDKQQQAQFERWLAADADHQRAWEQMEELQSLLGRVPSHTVRQVLGEQPNQGRRRALKQLGLVLMAGGGLYAAQSQVPWQRMVASQRTGSGEIRRLRLDDGTQLVINSGSAVDIRYSDVERRILLWNGEVLVESGHRAEERPLLVETAAGEVRALGTRFAVREIDGGSRVDLYEGALDISPCRIGHVRLQAGEGIWFSAERISAVRSADIHAVAWEQGKLVAERQPLKDFLNELGRHRRGVISVDPAVADLPITGVFPLADTDRILSALQQSLPIRVHFRTRYWVTVQGA